MMIKIELFLLVLSLVFTLKFVFEFILTLKEDDPEPMNISKTNQVFLYFAVSYILTSIINIFIN
jgi:hypothetical protein